MTTTASSTSTADRDRRALARAIRNLLHLAVDELGNGTARRIEGHGWTASRYPSQGAGRPDSDVIRIEIRVGSDWPDRFPGTKP